LFFFQKEVLFMQTANYRSQFLSETFIRLLRDLLAEGMSGTRIFITRDDPDARATSKIVAETLNTYNIPNQIYYAGSLSTHPQSRAMRDSGIFSKDEFKSISQIGQQKLSAILIDSCDLNEKCFGSGGIKPFLIIDHHETKEVDLSGVPFCLIKPVAASVSLGVDLVLSMGVELSQQAFTAAAIGIFSDSFELDPLEMTKLDYDIFHLAMEYGNQDIIEKVFSAKSSLEEQEYIESTLENARLIDGTGIVLARPNKPTPLRLQETIAESATVLRTKISRHSELRKGIRAIISWNYVCGGQGYRVSARSFEHGFPLDSWLKKLFGTHSAGARRRSGGARVSTINTRTQIDSQLLGEQIATFEQNLQQKVKDLSTRMVSAR